jgi:NAD(P)-dependent dehydrogenase (short-subunit alcohol dehydrogenase family)
MTVFVHRDIFIALHHNAESSGAQQPKGVLDGIDAGQGFIRKWIANGRKTKMVVTSSLSGIFTPAVWGTYVSTKHVLESIAEACSRKGRRSGSRCRFRCSPG